MLCGTAASCGRSGGTGMRKLAAGFVVAVALLAPAAPSGAAVVTDAAKAACGPKGSAAACKEYLYKQCVASAKQRGLTSTQAARVCGG